MKLRTITCLILLAAGIEVLGWDLFVALKASAGTASWNDTVSAVLHDFIFLHPVIAIVFVGMPLGHLAWPLARDTMARLK